VSRGDNGDARWLLAWPWVCVDCVDAPLAKALGQDERGAGHPIATAGQPQRAGGGFAESAARQRARAAGARRRAADKSGVMQIEEVRVVLCEKRDSVRGGVEKECAKRRTGGRRRRDDDSQLEERLSR